MGKCATKNRAFALGGEIEQDPRAMPVAQTGNNDALNSLVGNMQSMPGSGRLPGVANTSLVGAGMAQGISGAWHMAGDGGGVGLDPKAPVAQTQPQQTALGAVAPPGQGAGATYGWKAQTIAEQLGRKPNAGVPIYDARGNETRQSLSGRIANPLTNGRRAPAPEAPPADTYREPAQNTMTPVDSLFPPKLAFAGGGIVGGAADALRGTTKRIDDAVDAAVNGPAPQAVAQPAAKVSMGSEADNYAAQAAKLEAAQLAAAKARMAAKPKEKNMFGFAGGGVPGAGDYEEAGIQGARTPNFSEVAAPIVDSVPYNAAQFLPGVSVPLSAIAATVHADQGRGGDVAMDIASMAPGGRAMMLAKGTKLAGANGLRAIGRAANGTQLADSSGAFGEAAYAEGGKIKGPGTPTSDSIPAKVRETGEPIAVSTDERIVSKAQGRYLEAVAKGLGHASLDAMLEAGTGKPVGPTIKGGVKHAATGFASIPTQAEADQAAAARKQADIEAAAIQKENQRGFASAPTSSESKPLVGLPVVEKPALANLLFSSRPEPQQQPIAQPIAQQEAAPAIENPVATPTPTPAPTPAKTLSQVAQGGITIGDQGDGQYQYDRDPRFAANKQQVAMPSGAAQGNNLADATQMQAPQGGGYITNKAGKSMSLPGGDTPYVGIDGKPTGEWNKTQAYADAIARNERDKVRLSEMERDRYKRDMGPDIKDNRTIALAKLNLDRMDKDRAQQIDQAREDRRTGIAEEDSRRGAARFTLEQKLANMQLEDAGMIRSARNELNLALASGDRAKIEAAKSKAVAAGIKFDKPAETFKFIPSPMGGGVLFDEARGVGDIYGGDGKRVGSVSPPGAAGPSREQYEAQIRAKNPGINQADIDAGWTKITGGK